VRSEKPEPVMDTGMTVSEAVHQAGRWWDAVGRHLIKQGTLADYPHSGILRGDLFDDLAQREKVRIVRHWHYFFVKRPDLLDADPGAQFRLGGGESVH
jgi:hypothetical protein